MIFTRYLYLKDEVKYALLVSLLKREKEKTQFWFEEIQEEPDLLDWLKQIYPLLEKVEQNICQSIGQSIGLNVCQSIGQSIGQSIFDEDNQYINFSLYIKERNLKELEKYIMIDCDEMILPYLLQLFCKQLNIKKLSVDALVNKNPKYKRKIYLGIFIENIQEQKEEQKENIILTINETVSETVRELKRETKIIKPYKVLQHYAKYDINESNQLAPYLDKLERNKIGREELIERWRTYWLYYASFSLLWKSRIEKYKGIVNNETREINFPDEELENQFYSLYGYEPDEQTREVLERHIPLI
jgi:hypothetical protein